MVALVSGGGRSPTPLMIWVSGRRMWGNWVPQARVGRGTKSALATEEGADLVRLLWTNPSPRAGA